MDKIHQKAIHHLLFHCACLQSDDRLLILCDRLTYDLAEAFQHIANEVGDVATVINIPLLSTHGDEPPVFAADAMKEATLIISLCHYSLAHSKARVDAGLRGARFLSLPLYEWRLLEDPCVLVDFKAQQPIVEAFTQAFTDGNKVHVTTKLGTDIELDISGRVGNCCPGFVEKSGELGSPPDIESNVSPVEDGSNGIVVVDGSITHPEIGLLTSEIILKIRQGRIVEFSGKDKRILQVLEEMFYPDDSLRRILAECGVGLNPAAKLTGMMLTDEGVLGCMHFGFGSNHTVGGKNKVDFHLDFVFQEASLKVDDHPLLDEGVIKI
ncbi:MAG: hypothetical protein QNK11_01465 [Legionella sp.]|nr:hypothetical protein [Legionella sp.]